MNILMSYAYADEKSTWILKTMRENGCKILIDSGAFTAFNAHINVSLDGYCAWLKKSIGCYDEYIALDVIGSEDETQKSYRRMISSGFSPMGVVTIDDSPSVAKMYVEDNPRICVAGGAFGSSCLSWFPARMELISRITDHECSIHGLGFTPNGYDGKTCAKTVDSSSWKSGRRFGNIAYWDSSTSTLATKPWKKITAETMPDSLAKSLMMSNIDSVKLNENTRRISRMKCSVIDTVSIAAWLLRMISARRLHGQDVYLACIPDDLEDLLVIATNFNSDGSVNFEKIDAERGHVLRELKKQSVVAKRYIQKALDNYWAVSNEY